MNSVAYLPQSKRLPEQVSEVLRYKHYSLKTEQAYRAPSMHLPFEF
jgi:hypothetical protein